MATALAGPDGSLTELESQAAGQQTRVLVVSIPSAGGPRTVLSSELTHAPLSVAANETALLTDPSGRWILLWPTTGTGGPRDPQFLAAGWISGGRLHPLPGVAQVFPQDIAW